MWDPIPQTSWNANIHAAAHLNDEQQRNAERSKYYFFDNNMKHLDSNEDSILNPKVGNQIRQIFRYPTDIFLGLWRTSKQGSVIPTNSEPVVVWSGWLWRSKLAID